MPYSPTTVVMNKVSGAPAYLGSFTLGQTNLGNTSTYNTPVTLTGVSYQGGYSVTTGLKRAGRLVMDPYVGQATFTQKLPSTTVFSPSMFNNPPFQPGDKFNLKYGSITAIAGAISEVSVDLDRQSDGSWVRTYAYQFRDGAGIMLDALWTHSSKPSQGALTRLLEAAAIVNLGSTKAYAGPGLNWMNAASASPIDAGAEPYLDVARQFSELTGYTLRPADSLRPNELVLVEDNVKLGAADNWIISTVGSGTVSSWVTSATFRTAVNGQPPVAQELKVKLDDTRWIGQRAGIVLDVFGTLMAVSQVKCAFTPRQFTSSVEVTPVLYFPDGGSPNN